MSPRRESEPRKLGDVLKRTLSRIDKDGHLARKDARTVWADIAGERISSHTSVLALKNGELIIGVDSATWASELGLMAEELLARFNQEAVQNPVKSIRFTVSKRPDDEKRTEEALGDAQRRYGGARVTPVPLDPAERAAVERSLEAIEDPGLQEAARRATIADLEWKKGQGLSKTPHAATGGVSGRKSTDMP